MLPRVKIYFENGLLGSVTPSDDGVAALIATGVVVGTTFLLATPYLLTSLDNLTELGITEANNPTIYKAVKEFYTEAPTGSKLWIYGVADTVKLTDMVDITGVHGKKILNAANGEINILMLSKKDASGYTPTVTDGLDSDVYAAITKAQELAEWATDEKFAPCMVVIPGRHYSGTPSDLADLGEKTDNRVCVLIGDSIKGSTDAAVGLLAGRISVIPVQRSIARVKSGAIGVDTLYIGIDQPEFANPEVIHDAGFITFRTFVGKAGYYFTDDKLATDPTEDYALIPRRRTIDKAYRIAYQTLMNELNDEIPVTDTGTIPAAIVKNMQNVVETAIVNTMTANGELGNDPTDPNDVGVQCYIDHTQNVVQTGQLKVKVRIKPFGYPKYIDVYLGFQTATT